MCQNIHHMHTHAHTLACLPTEPLLCCPWQSREILRNYAELSRKGPSYILGTGIDIRIYDDIVTDI